SLDASTVDGKPDVDTVVQHLTIRQPHNVPDWLRRRVMRNNRTSRNIPDPQTITNPRGNVATVRTPPNLIHVSQDPVCHDPLDRLTSDRIIDDHAICR